MKIMIQCQHMKKIILSLIIIISFIIFFASSIFLNVCFPDGCFYDIQNSVCRDGNCVDESIISHLEEKSSFVMAIVNNNLPFFCLLILLILVFIFYENNKKLLELQSKLKVASKHFTLDHNLFTILFAKGILNPKIF